MKERIEEKMVNIREYLQQLDEISPNVFYEYKNDWKTKAICERLCEKIAEAIVDISFLIFKKELDKDKNIKIPKDDSEVIEILRDRKIISIDLCKRLIELKSMRNWLAHKYEEIDDEIIFHASSEELSKDIPNFLDSINKYLEIEDKNEPPIH